jgi:hypothetical protein
MPMNNFSVGRDITLAVTTAQGQLGLHTITKFTSKQDTTSNKVKLLDGRIFNQRFPDGWSGSLEVERADSTLDDYMAELEANYFAGMNETGCSITEIIQEPNGSLSEYQYTGVVFTLTDAGNWAGDTTVKQTMNWVASRRIKRA